MMLIVAPLFGGGTKEGTSAGVPSYRGVVAYLEGDVTIDGVAGEIGQEVPPGAVVITSPEAYCEILFGEQNIFRIQEDTLVKLNIGKETGKVDLTRGTMAFLLNKLKVLGKEAEFNVTTPSMVAGVRGTVFFIKVESENRTYVCACNGTLLTADLEDEQEQKLEAQHHAALYYSTTGDGKTEVTPAAMLYHTDEDLDALGARIGYKIPWGP